jgi:hypothetical protein
MVFRLSIQLFLGFFLVQCVNFALDDFFLFGICQYSQYLYDQKQVEIKNQESNGLFGIRKHIKKELKSYVGIPQNLSKLRYLTSSIVNVLTGFLLMVYFAYVFVITWSRFLEILSKRDKKNRNLVAIAYNLCCKKYNYSIFSIIIVLINLSLIVVLFYLRENACNMYDTNSVYLYQFHSQYHRLVGKGLSSKHELNHLNINHSISRLLIYLYINIKSLNWAIFSLLAIVILTALSFFLSIFS